MHGTKWCGFLPACLAIALSIALVVAMQYCTLEALTAHPVSAEGPHHEAADHPHDGHLPTSGHTEETLCCFALQAIDTPPTVVSQFGLLAKGITYLLSLNIHRWENPFEPTQVASGLSPPPREPTPHTLFYRTVFATHAPPLCPA